MAMESGFLGRQLPLQQMYRRVNCALPVTSTILLNEKVANSVLLGLSLLALVLKLVFFVLQGNLAMPRRKWDVRCVHRGSTEL